MIKQDKDVKKEYKQILHFVRMTVVRSESDVETLRKAQSDMGLFLFKCQNH